MYLNCHSYFSLRYGTFSIEELVQAAVRNGIPYLALTDIHVTTGVFDFVKCCHENGVKPIVGMEVRHTDRLSYIALAANQEGLREINDLVTRANLGENLLPTIQPEFSNVFTIYPSHNVPDRLKPNEYIGISRSDLQSFNHPLLKKTDQLVALNPVTFQDDQHFELHKLLRCVDHNILYSKLTNHWHANPLETMLPWSTMLGHYKRWPAIIRNTNQLAEQCNFEFDYKGIKNKKTFTGSRYEDKMLLETLAYEGFRTRYDLNDKVAKERLDSELDIIDQLDFACYFLTTWDIIRFSLHHDYFHVGRGSGANSIVAYCLRITEVDPIELNLYFARFLNTKRSNPPDFDIDWSWKDRDHIISYVFKRFGRQHTGFCGTITDFKYRSIVRELGKVYGLPKEELDFLSRSPGEQHEANSIVANIHHYGNRLKGFPNSFSMHACGIFITDQPISYYSTMNVYQKGVPTCEIDMYIAEDINLHKLDILSQRGLGTIRDTIDLVHENQDIKVDITQVKAFKSDPKCNAGLAKGKTLGCFYIESPAMRGLLRRLKCDNYETLVAASSIIRPGVAQSGMMREYVERHRDPSRIKYFHPIFEEQLRDTYGVMVYQEDVIKIAHHFAKLGLDDADVLRRGMSGKHRGKKELELIEKRFFENCSELNYPEELTQEVYRQIASFAGYSFCKSHSASYAVESYQSLYLKTYFPLEFMTAVVNNHGGFYRQEVYINEARIDGAQVQAPDVNTSRSLAHIKGKVIHLGLNQIIHVSQRSKQIIPEERHRNGTYHSLESLVDRTGIDKQDLEYLIYAGALRSLKLGKMELIMRTRRLFNRSSPQPQSQQLFELPRKELTLPSFTKDPLEDVFDELEGLGFPVSISPFQLLKTSFRGDIKSAYLTECVGQTVRMVGYLVSIKDVPIKSRGQQRKMNFGTWIDVQGDYFDTVHFPDSLGKYPFKGLGCYLLLGKVVVDFDFPSVEVIKMARLPMVDDPRYSEEGEKGQQALLNLPVAHSKTFRSPYPSQEELDQLYGRTGTAAADLPIKKPLEGHMSIGGRK